MKKFTFLIALVALLGLNVACDNNRGGDEAQREEFGQEVNEDMEEVREDVDDATDELE